MSFGDLYTVPPGQDVGQGLPPVNLPSIGSQPRPRIKIEVPVRPAAAAPIEPKKVKAETYKLPDGYGDEPPAELRGGQSSAKSALPDGYGDEPPPETEKKLQRPIGGIEAGARGALNMAIFGAGPAIAGLSEAGGMARPADKIAADEQGMNLGDLASPFVGAAKLLHDKLLEHAGVNLGGLSGQVTGDQQSEAQKAYERGRQAALEGENAAREQHPYAFLAGQLAGAMMSPGFGAMRAGTLGQRALGGVIGGATGGGLYGGGSSISQGREPADVALDTATGAALGGATGGLLGGAFGPRLANAGSPGSQAARTAEDLGAPLPRGLASDSKFVQGSTAKFRSIPFAGEKIGEGVEETQKAAGKRVAGIANQMAGGVTDRAAADAIVRPGLEAVIDANRGRIDQAYNALRNELDQNRRFSMPRLQAALQSIRQVRAEAGWEKPSQGLEQFENVSRGANFNGAHRARVDAREAGDVLSPHPGYNRADYNRLTRAMTADLRDIVSASATRNPTRALQLFDKAEEQFGKLAEQNGLLRKLADSKGEGAIATLLGSAQKIGGNLRLLAQLKNSMAPDDFAQIGGVLLHELGHNRATNGFSLAQFVSRWDDVSDRAKSLLFSPQHLQDIENIVGLGQHIKKSLSYSNTSHTASVLVLIDIAKDVALLAADIAKEGLPGTGAMLGAGTSVGLWMLTRWLASPSKAASMSAWSTAFRDLISGPGSPVRVARFNIATRNLAHNLNLPMQNVMGAIERRLTNAQPESAANNEAENQ